MTLNEYQMRAGVTAGEGCELGYCVVALGGEVGEALNVYKKFLRQDFCPEEFSQRMKGELGDVLWYLQETCTTLGFTLGEVAQYNLDKVTGRKSRGTLRGDGEQR